MFDSFSWNICQYVLNKLWRHDFLYISLISPLIKPFFYMTKISGKKNKYISWKVKGLLKWNKFFPSFLRTFSCQTLSDLRVWLYKSISCYSKSLLNLAKWLKILRWNQNWNVNELSKFLGIVHLVDTQQYLKFWCLTSP